jgi:hypothetical protein
LDGAWSDGAETKTIRLIVFVMMVVLLELGA